MNKIYDKHTILVASISMLLCAALIFAIFTAKQSELERQIKTKHSEFTRVKSLVSKKTELQSAYSKLRHRRDVNSSADWIKYLTETSKKEGIILDGIMPKPIETGNEYNYSLRFKTTLANFSSFIYSVSSEDPLCKIDSVSLKKIDNGALDCEVSVSRMGLR